MMIDTTNMKYGKRPSGRIGITTKPRSVQIWKGSHYIVNETFHSLAKFTEQDEKVITTDKEETRARLFSDRDDGAKPQKLISTCIQPFDTSVKGLCNIYTGEIYLEKTNANKSYEIGSEFMFDF